MTLAIVSGRPDNFTCPAWCTTDHVDIVIGTFDDMHEAKLFDREDVGVIAIVSADDGTWRLYVDLNTYRETVTGAEVREFAAALVSAAELAESGQ